MRVMLATIAALLLAGCPQATDSLDIVPAPRSSPIAVGVYAGHAAGTITCSANGQQAGGPLAFEMSLEITSDQRVFIDGIEMREGDVWPTRFEFGVIQDVAITSLQILVTINVSKAETNDHVTYSITKIDDVNLGLVFRATTSDSSTGRILCSGEAAGTLAK